jgi:branched-chain amino acid transport system substrate-binding protein
VVAGCGGDSSSATEKEAGPFKIGVAGPMTGQYATYGASHKAGAEIAVAELNEAGGVNGAQVSFVLGDDLGDPKEAVLVAQKFIDDNDIVVVDGHQFSGATIAAGGKYEAAGLPMISPSATNPDITDLGPYTWRICMTDAVQGEGLAKYSVTTLGKSKVGIIYDNSDYGRGLANAFEKGVKAAGGTVGEKQQYAAGNTDFKAQLTKLKAAGIELLFMSGYYPEGSKIAQQAKELGMKMPMLGSDGYASDELPKLGAAAVEGMLVSTFFDYTKEDEAVQKFVKAYQAKYKGQNPDWFAANSYDVIMLAAKAAETAGKNDRASINETLATIGAYEGISGSIQFDENGDVIKPLSIVVVEKGRLVTAPQQPTQ